MKSIQNINNNNNFNNGQQEVADSGTVCHHIVQLQPTNRDLLDIATVPGVRLNAKKFDVSSLAPRDFPDV